MSRDLCKFWLTAIFIPKMQGEVYLVTPSLSAEILNLVNFPLF